MYEHMARFCTYLRPTSRPVLTALAIAARESAVVLRSLFSRRIWQQCVWAILSLHLANSAQAGPVLHIATWDITHAEKTIGSQKKKAKAPSWRHTFGAERGDRRQTKLKAFNLDVDIVMLQGAQNIGVVRRMFPARDWKLILSRDYRFVAPRLGRLPDDLSAFDISAQQRTSPKPITAIAVRYQRRLRVRGIEHIGERPSGTGPAFAEPPPSAIAVRVNYFGRPAWFVSSRGPGPCAPSQAECSFKTAISDWYNEKIKHGPVSAPALVGYSVSTLVKTGRATLDAAVDKEARCGKLEPASPDGLLGAKLGEPHRLSKPKLGCIVLSRLYLKPPVPRQHPLPLPKYELLGGP